MSLIRCNECGNEKSTNSICCPSCGNVERSVGPGLGIGIFLLPIIFVWFTLRKGHTILARGVAFCWLIVTLMLAGSDIGTGTKATASGPQEPPPINQAPYHVVDADVGCKSVYSDDKKKDIFRTEYKNHWFIWSGEIVTLDADSVSIDIDGASLQDLSVRFADPKAGYNLTKGETITVKFQMKSAGGCFLPFTGRQAVLEG